jgi:hypothetical protein
VFDVYQGKGVPDGKKSIAIGVTLQPADRRTLTDAEIEAIAQKIVAAVTKATGASLADVTRDSAATILLVGRGRRGRATWRDGIHGEHLARGQVVRGPVPGGRRGQPGPDASVRGQEPARGRRASLGAAVATIDVKAA